MPRALPNPGTDIHNTSPPQYAVLSHAVYCVPGATCATVRRLLSAALLCAVRAIVPLCCSGQALLLDVRLGSKYESSHAAASLSAPLYLPIQKWDVASIIRRAGFAFFGIYGTELNTAFAEEVQQRLPKGARPRARF